MNAHMSTVYARYEPTTDRATLNNFEADSIKRCLDVVIYHDAACTAFYCRIPWHYTKSKPTKRNKYITLNCYRYKLQWVKQ